MPPGGLPRSRGMSDLLPGDILERLESALYHGVGAGGLGGLNAHNKDLYNKAYLRKYSPLPPSPLPLLRSL